MNISLFASRLTAVTALVSALTLTASCRSADRLEATPGDTDLRFSQPARTWDEGIPLGNATVGALVWQRGDALRFSLDRADLWDLRPMDSLSGPEYSFDWVCRQAESGDYGRVQRKFDAPYEAQPAPSKIPGAALEFPGVERLGQATSVRLFLHEALCEVKWSSGARLQTFVHATEPVGWFRFEGVPTDFFPILIPPRYGRDNAGDGGNSIDGQGLGRLGYKQGAVYNGKDTLRYHQEGWGGFSYDVVVCMERRGQTLTGVWSITSSLSDDRAADVVEAAMRRGLLVDYRSHRRYWTGYWAASGVTLPDSLLQRQYDSEMYKFGAAARPDAYPISLQSVWTADDGGLPPWKGDYHHDLNTQLSYWPAYAANHLREAEGYVNTLWRQRPVYRRYTQEYFGVTGLNVPGVCTLTGEPMGGWIQYAMSQTVSAWLLHHFYLQWRYSGDEDFLEQRAYPFACEVGNFLEQMTRPDSVGRRRLRLSSSPEYGDNSAKAWFKDMTNFDLTLIHSAWREAAAMAEALGRTAEAARWRALEAQLPSLDTASSGALTVAPGYPYAQSHRHFSHAMAIYPLGLLDMDGDEASRHIIRSTIRQLDSIGPAYWTGYSYAWLACLKARARDGEGAARALRTFAECFCLPNTFHANGDQTRSGKSRFTYRPFTLEGNFAFAAGLQEMLLQSYGGRLRLFPAVPAAWPAVSFRTLRAEGAFLVTASLKRGESVTATVSAESDATLRLIVPDGYELEQAAGAAKGAQASHDLIELPLKAGATARFIFRPHRQ